MKKTFLAAVVGGLLSSAAYADWVYLGKFGAEGAQSTGFAVKQLPAVGGTIETNRGMNLRSDRPRLKGGSWQLGEVTGVLYPGQQFAVEEVATSRSGSVPGDVWVRGRVQH